MVSVFTIIDKRRNAKRSGSQLIEFTYAHVKWFYGQSDYYLNYFIKYDFNDRKSNIYKQTQLIY